MRFGSVCSGIEAASVAWEPLGWKAAWFSEIEPFPCAVLKHHYPDVPNLGDMTALPAMIRSGQVEVPDILCGGTPCQAFSVAGLRQSLSDERGNLSLTFCEIADAIDEQRKSIIFWENVPGVFSTKDNAFGCFLAGLAGEDEALVPPGGRWTNAGFIDGPQRAVAWRILDAQYFGVAQRRRRVFVVASARADFDPAAVLFEFDGLRRDTAPSREAGKVASTLTAPRSGGGGSYRLNAHDVDGGFVQPVCPTLRAGGNQTGGDRPPGTDVDTVESLIVAHAFDARQSDVIQYGDKTGPLDTDGHSVAVMQPVGVFQDSEFGVQQYDSAGTLRAGRIPEHQMVLQPAIAWDEELNASVEQAGTLLRGGDGGRHDGVAVAVRTANTSANGHGISPELAHTLDQTQGQAVAFQVGPQSGEFTDIAPTLDCRAKNGPIQNQLGAGVMQAMQVRRLTPVECERLQGFPDGYTAIPWRNKPASECPDGPRYKALGNSWAVPVVRWIGERIERCLD